MPVVQFLLYFFFILVNTKAQFESYCTPSEASIDGNFVCLSECDKEHSICDYGSCYQYCLSYFPNKMGCPIIPFDREKILTCNGEFSSPDSPNHWIVLMGGSNAYFEVKNLIDILLDLPQGTRFDPLLLYDNNLVNAWDIGSIFDFIWNSSNNVIHKGFFPFQDNSYFNIPYDTASHFLNVPVPVSGAIRISFLFTHYATNFQSFFDLMVAAGSPWLDTNPAMDVKLEWSGVHGDDWADKAVHINNILYMNNRKVSEGINIRSFVMTDSAFDCWGKGYDSQYAILDAIDETPSSFPVSFWSKRTMANQQFELTGFCMTDSHAYPGITHVFTNRYLNQICKPDRIISGLLADEICFDVDSDPSCFYNPEYWNFVQVCRYDYHVDIKETVGFCLVTNPNVMLPVCEAVPNEVNNMQPTNNLYYFNIFVYGSFAIALTYILCTFDGICEVRHVFKRYVKSLKEKEHSTNTRDNKFRKIVVRSRYKKENDIDAASKDIKLESKDYINDDIEKPNKFVLTEDALEMLQKTLNKFDSLTYPDSNTIEKSKISLVTPSSRFESIGFARYLASVHIVMGHLYQAGHLPSFHNFSTFGFTWVPWFFLLSGFILSTAEAKRSKKQQDALDYVLRRLQTIYPTYLLGIFISIITAGILKGPQSLPPSVDMFMYIFLLQSWIPSLVEKGCIYLTQCWFLTCLVFYWTIFFHIQSFINKLNPKDLLYLVIITSLILPILYHLSAFGQQDWYNDHKYLRSSEGVDVAVLILKYNPLAYLHIFTLGCCLPQIQRMIQSFTYFKYAAPYMASVAYASMLMLFLYSSGDILQGFKLGMRLGAISSLQSLLLLGLCNEQDWLAYLFSSPVLSRLSDISFSQYVFQFLVWEWYESITHNTVADIRFFLILFTTSVLISAVITPFNSRENLSRLFVLASTYLIVYSICQPLLSAPGVQSHIKYATEYNPPAYFNDTPVVFNIKDDGRDIPIFNPSFSSQISDSSMYASFDARILISARRDWVETTWSNWYDESFIINRWYTQVLLGHRVAKAKYKRSVTDVVLEINDFIPCMPQPICNKNGTLVMKVSKGPEDPRIFVFKGSTYISFFSYDNIVTSLNREAVTSSSYLGFFGTGTHICEPTGDGLIGRMYVTKLYSGIPINKCITSPLVPVYQDTMNFTINSIVKNWLAFSYQDDLYFIHQISPEFIVLRVATMTETNWSTSIASVSKTPTKVQLLNVSDSIIHGSANPVLINASKSSWKRDYYLSIFHILSNDSDSNYASYFFSFSPLLPFRINGVSTRIELNLQSYSSMNCGGKASPFGFVSGLEVFVCRNESLGLCVDVGYGVCDMTSRKITMRLLDLEKHMMTFFK